MVMRGAKAYAVRVRDPLKKPNSMFQLVNSLKYPEPQLTQLFNNCSALGHVATTRSAFSA